MRIALLLLAMSLASHAQAAPQCSELFDAPAIGVVTELARLRVEIDAVRSSGNPTLARMLYQDFLNRYNSAVATGVDLKALPRIFDKLTRIKDVTTRTNTIRDENRWLHPWIKMPELPATRAHLNHVFITSDGKGFIEIQENSRLVVKRFGEEKPRLEIQTGATQISQLSVSADRTLALFEYLKPPQQKIQLYSLVTGEKIFEHHGERPALSADGSHIVFQINNNTVVVNRTTNSRWILRDVNGSFQLSHDGSRLFAQDHRIPGRIWNVPDQLYINVFHSSPTSAPAGFSFNPANSGFAYVETRTKRMMISDGAPNSKGYELSSDQLPHQQSQFSPDGRWLVGFGGFTNSIVIWDMTSKTIVSKLELPSPISTVSFSADSATLLLRDYDANLHLFKINVDGESPR